MLGEKKYKFSKFSLIGVMYHLVYKVMSYQITAE